MLGDNCNTYPDLSTQLAQGAQAHFELPCSRGSLGEQDGESFREEDGQRDWGLEGSVPTTPSWAPTSWSGTLLGGEGPGEAGRSGWDQ